MRCPSCGRDNTNPGNFCIYCGADLLPVGEEPRPETVDDYGYEEAFQEDVVDRSGPAPYVAPAPMDRVPRRYPRRIVLIALLLILLGAGGFLLFSSGLLSGGGKLLPTSGYSKGIQLKEEGRYQEAIEEFRKDPGNSDSAAQIKECQNLIAYDEAVALYDRGEYADSIYAFRDLNGFQDSKTYIAKAVSKLEEAGIGYYRCTAKPNLRIRSQPFVPSGSQPENKIGKIQLDEIVYIDGFDSDYTRGWGHVKHNGVEGWCSMEYLSWVGWER